MRKFKFYYIVALVGAMVLSMSSCTKDLEDDVDALRKEVEANKSAIAALDSAIKSGKLITAVNPKADKSGWDIVFSDNTTITVTNGAKGEQGGAGAQGPIGPIGSDGFSPVIDVDAEGYWTIQQTKDGLPERVTGADGLPVSAKPSESQKVKIDEDGFLCIGDTKTNISNLPAVVINKTEGTATIRMWDGTEWQNFTVILEAKAFGIDMVRSAVIPYNTAAGYLEVVITNGKAANTFVGGPFAGKITKGDVFKSSGSLPVIINPVNAVINSTMVSLVDKDEEALDIDIEGVERGFSGAFTRAAAPTNGLWTIKLKANANTPTTTTDFIAVKVKTGEDVVYTSYDYRIKTGEATTVTLAPFTGSRAIGKAITFAGSTDVVKDGKTENLFKVNADDIMLSDIQLDESSKQYAKYIDFVKDGKGNVIGVQAKNDGASHIALNDKKLTFIYTVVDYNGNSQNYVNGTYAAAAATKAEITFLTLYDFDTFALDAVSHTILETPATKDVFVDLDKLFNELGGDLHGIWRNYSNDLDVKIRLEGEKIKEADGISAVITKADQATAVTVGADFPRYIKLTFDNGVVLPGNYVATMTYTDSRNGGNVKKFTTTVAITVANPADVLEKLNVTRVPAYFTGDNVITYGTANASKIAQSNPLDTKLDLLKLYNNLNGAKAVFEFTPVVTLIGTPETQFKITNDNMYKSFAVKVFSKYAGNDNNKILVDEFTITAKSEVKEGSIVSSKNLSVTAGESGVKVKIADVCVAKDVYGNDLKAFIDTKDSRIAKVEIVKDETDANKSLISTPVYDATEKAWVVTATSEIITMNDVNIDLNIVITDQFGQTKEGKVTVTVKKKI